VLKRKILMTCLAIDLIVSLVGCAPSQGRDPAAGAEEPPPDEPTLGLISMLRVSGSRSRYHDRLMISPTGELATNGPIFGHQRRQLPDEAISQLIQAFEGFAHLDRAYPPPPDARGDVQYQIRYSGHEVRASAANPGLPPQLQQIIQLLEQLAGG